MRGADRPGVTTATQTPYRPHQFGCLHSGYFVFDGSIHPAFRTPSSPRHAKVCGLRIQI